MNREDPLTQFIRDKGGDVRATLNDPSLTDVAKLARVAVIGLRWAVDSALHELSQSKPRP